MTNISPAPGEEETRSQTILIIVFAGNRTGDSGLSSASHAVQPEDALFVIPISPCHYLREDIDSGFWEAERVVLFVIRVKGCLGSGRQELKKLRVVILVPITLEINVGGIGI